jgi:simple sugar transport system permease protein
MLDALFQASILVSIAAATIRIATPLLLAALGELVAERGGVYNMGLEGMMLMGAFTGYLAAYASGSLWVGVAAAGFTGALMAFVFAVMVITLKVEQIVTGLAVNLLGAGLSTYWLRAAFAGDGQTPTIQFFSNDPIPYLSELP